MNITCKNIPVEVGQHLFCFLIFQAQKLDNKLEDNQRQVVQSETFGSTSAPTTYGRLRTFIVFCYSAKHEFSPRTIKHTRFQEVHPNVHATNCASHNQRSIYAYVF